MFALWKGLVRSKWFVPFCMGAFGIVISSVFATWGHPYFNDLTGFYVKLELVAPLHEEVIKMLFAYLSMLYMRRYGVKVSWRNALLMTAFGFAMAENVARMYESALLPAHTSLGQWFNPIYIGGIRHYSTTVMHITTAYMNSIIPLFGYVWHLTFNALCNTEGVQAWQIVAFTYLPWAGHIIRYVVSRISVRPIGRLVFAITTIMLLSAVLVASMPTATPVDATCVAQPDGSFSCNNGAFVCAGVNDKYESFTNALSDGSCVYR